MKEWKKKPNQGWPLISFLVLSKLHTLSTYILFYNHASLYQMKYNTGSEKINEIQIDVNDLSCIICEKF